jgi:hypothetical protein
MGSDFLVAFLAAGRKKTLDVGAGRSALERLRITPLEDWPRDFLEDECGDVPDDPDEAELMKNEFVELLMEDLHMIEEELSPDGSLRRDLWSGTIGNKFVIMSGGMSWGDAPTEAFRSLDRLTRAGVTRAMGFDV